MQDIILKHTSIQSTYSCNQKGVNLLSEHFILDNYYVTCQFIALPDISSTFKASYIILQYDKSLSDTVAIMITNLNVV